MKNFIPILIVCFFTINTSTVYSQDTDTEEQKKFEEFKRYEKFKKNQKESKSLQDSDKKTSTINNEDYIAANKKPTTLIKDGYEVQDLLYIPLGDEKVIDITYGGSTSTAVYEVSGSKIADITNFYNSSTISYGQGINDKLAIGASVEMVFGNDTYTTNDTTNSFYSSVSSQGLSDFQFLAAYELSNQNNIQQLHISHSPGLKVAISPGEDDDGNAARGGDLTQIGYKFGTNSSDGQWMLEIEYAVRGEKERENAKTRSTVSKTDAVTDLLLKFEYQWEAISKKHFHQLGYSYFSYGERKSSNNVNSNETIVNSYSAGMLSYKYSYKTDENSLFSINIDSYSSPEYSVDFAGTDVDIVEDSLVRYTAGYTKTF
jgi:hypothetical protein